MKVGIIGCGYVGLELARQLAERGHEVIGVRRSESGLDAIETVGANVSAMRADVTEPKTLERLPAVDGIVYAASSGGRGPEAAREVYVDGLENIISEYGSRTSPPDRVLYTSSTGVYGDHEGAWVTEETQIEPTTERTRVLATAESLALEKTAAHGIDGTVLRFGGLYGPDRYRLSRYLEGPVTEGYRNMIHRDDAAGAVRYCLEAEVARNETVLVVDDEPVAKAEFADWLADACNVSRPEKQSKAQRMTSESLAVDATRRIETSKRCSNERLREIGYELSFPTFREGYRNAIEAYKSEN